MYFSMVTYTTLGFGDVVIEGHWRILAAFQSANGIIMFGWTTALITAAVSRLYSVDHHRAAENPWRPTPPARRHATR